MNAPNDADIVTTVAVHPGYGKLYFARISQDRRTYYRLMCNSTTGSLIDALHARQTIAYWGSKGWIVSPANRKG